MSVAQFFQIHPLDQLYPTILKETIHTNQDLNCQIIVINSGNAVFNTCMESHVLSANNICYICPGQAYQLLPDKDLTGFSLSFNSDFLNLSVETSLLSNDITFIGLKSTIKFQADACTKSDIDKILISISREFSSALLHKSELIKSLLILLLIYLSRIPKEKISNGALDKNNEIAERFFRILDQKYTSHRMAADYADMLSVTSNFLNELLKKTSGYTTRYHIHHRIITEAKRLTADSGTSMKEIAYGLGFDDLAHFSKFFKKASGECYKDFKKKVFA